MVSYIRLMHPLTGLSAAAAAYVGSVVAGSLFVPARPILLVLLAVFLIASGGMVANDIADAAADKTNNPKRPIPSGKVTKSKAIAWAVVLLAAGNFATFYFLGREALYITIVATAIFVAYSTTAKRIPLISNLLASVLLVIAILFGSFVQGSYNAAVPLMVLAFLFSMSKEIYKSAEEALGEKHQLHATIATKIGVIRARMLGSLFVVATVIASFAVYFMNLSGIVYLFFAVIADIVFVAASVVPLRLSSRFIKAAMIIMFLAFLANAYNVRYLISA